MASTHNTIDLDDDLAELGPIDYIVVEFPVEAAHFDGEMAKLLDDLVERGLINIWDLLLIKKEQDGTVDVVEVTDMADAEADTGLRRFAPDVAALLAEADITNIAEAIAPGSIAAVLVWENAWAAPFASSIRRAGGQLIASGRLPVQAILAALEAEASS